MNERLSDLLEQIYDAGAAGVQMPYDRIRFREWFAVPGRAEYFTNLITEAVKHQKI